MQSLRSWLAARLMEKRRENEDWGLVGVASLRESGFGLVLGLGEIGEEVMGREIKVFIFFPFF